MCCMSSAKVCMLILMDYIIAILSLQGTAIKSHNGYKNIIMSSLKHWKILAIKQLRLGSLRMMSSLSTLLAGALLNRTSWNIFVL